MSEKLERCPFCGGDVDFWTKEAAEDYQALIIDCKDCPANMEEWIYKYDKNFAENFEKKKAEMFEAWNRRIERTAKVVNKEIDYRDDEYEHDRLGGQFQKGKCGICKHRVIEEFDFCPSCGARLEWE